MSRSVQLKQNFVIPVVAVVLGLMFGVLAMRAYFPSQTRPDWWEEASVSERKSFQSTARMYLKLDDEKRAEFVSLHRTLHADNDEGERTRQTLASYRDWVGGLTGADRAEYDVASDSERAKLYREHRSSDSVVANVEQGDIGDAQQPFIPKIPRLSDTQVMNVFHLVEPTLELSADERSLLNRTLGMNRAWLTLTYSLRAVPVGRGPFPTLWPPIPVAREIAQRLPEGAAREHLLPLRDSDTAKWIGKTIATHLQQDMHRLMRDLVGGEQIPRLTSGSNRVLQNRRIASEERMDDVAEALGVTGTELRLAIRWVIQTSGRGGNGQGRAFGSRPAIHEQQPTRSVPR